MFRSRYFVFNINSLIFAPQDGTFSYATPDDHTNTLTTFTNILLIQQNRRECVPCRCDLSRGSIASPFWRDNLNEYSHHTASHETARSVGRDPIIHTRLLLPTTWCVRTERSRTYYDLGEYQRLCVWVRRFPRFSRKLSRWLMVQKRPTRESVIAVIWKFKFLFVHFPVFRQSGSAGIVRTSFPSATVILTCQLMYGFGEGCRT